MIVWIELLNPDYVNTEYIRSIRILRGTADFLFCVNPWQFVISNLFLKALLGLSEHVEAITLKNA